MFVTSIGAGSAGHTRQGSLHGPFPSPSPGPSRGFSLIEVLVALLVLGIGLLGLAALQAQGLRYNTDSYVRSQATTLAYDIIDRIRANRDNAAAYASADLSAVGSCSAAGTASVNNDLACWLGQLNAGLPGVSPNISTNAADGNYLDITLSWLDREPREFSSGVSPRVPASSDDCLYPDGNTGATAFANRQWDGTNSLCLITQVWTVRP